ncbi:hypothetical protein G7Y89_g14531 [Cudoniella acicularis]|uniref:Uncharacterized protein n=1 Tax=Cudoniella acicularis TaxID=354080 RepID=A0A8H4R1M4_9HELO|nr:hypothetical protein G7Y89_g14531 [Cudoniella acicularis]
MKLSALFAIVFASTAFAAAIPAMSPNPDFKCIWDICGRCNGTSCMIFAFDNEHCDVGSCTKQSGAGDGTPCGRNNKAGSPVVCPGNGGVPS